MYFLHLEFQLSTESLSALRRAARATKAAFDLSFSPRHSRAILHTFSQALEQEQPSYPKLVEKADRFSASYLRHAARTLVLDSWAQRAPLAALKHGLALNEATPFPFLRDLAVVWSEHDPDAAFDALDTLPRKMRAKLEEDMLRSIARQDPTAAFSQWKARNPERKYSTVFETLFSQLAKLSVTATLKETELLPPESRRWADAVVAAEWASSEPMATLDWLDNNPPVPANNYGVATKIVTGTFEKSPEALLSKIANLQQRELKESIATALSGHWIEQDITAAVGCATSSGADRELRKRIAFRVAQTLWRDGLAVEAVNLMNAVPEANVGEEIAELMNTHPAAVPLDEAARLVDTIQDKATRDPIQRAIESRLSEGD